MLNRYGLVAIASLVWTLFGMLFLTPAVYFVLGYSRVLETIGFAAIWGAVTGLIVGIVAASPVVHCSRTSSGFSWVLLGSMLGAVIGLGALLWIGGFPRRTQADLSLVLLGPASLVVGTGLGVVGAVVLWHRQRTH